MARRRKSCRRKGCRTYVIGKGKFWDGVKNILKKTKILSTAANLIPGVGGAIGNVVSNLGYGKRRRRRHRRGGMANPFYKPPPEKKGPPYAKGSIVTKEMLAKAKHWKDLKKASGRKHRRHRNTRNNIDNRYIDNKIRVL